MAEEVRLVKPDPAYQEAYLAFYQEWVDSQEDMVPWVISKDPSDFGAMVAWLQSHETGENLPEGWVPSSTRWLVTEDDRIVGAVNIRHDLTEWLRNAGGHIGYGIPPSQRRKGYAAKLLALALVEAQALGITSALVVCDAVNTASERTILRNGGVQDTSYTEENGNVVHRFWIALEEGC